MKRYIKNGAFYNGSCLYIGEGDQMRMVINPSEEDLLANGWEVYVAPEVVLTDEQKLENAKYSKVDQINQYDNSSAVNQFTIGSEEMWLDHDQRQQLKTSVEAYAATGAENVTKWFNNKEYTFPVATWLGMLAQLEVYAGDAKNVTDAHIAAVQAMENIEDIEAFDYTAGYPAKLIF